MPYMMVDDGMPGHPKWIRVMDEYPDRWANCMALWVTAGTHCSRYLTNGVFPATALRRMTPLSAEQIDEALDVLVNVGLMHREGDKYRFHNWLKRQRSREQVERDRAANAERQRKWRERNAVTNAVGNAVSNDSNSTPLHSTPLQKDMPPETAGALAGEQLSMANVEPGETMDRPSSSAEQERAIAIAMTDWLNAKREAIAGPSQRPYSPESAHVTAAAKRFRKLGATPAQAASACAARYQGWSGLDDRGLANIVPERMFTSKLDPFVKEAIAGRLPEPCIPDMHARTKPAWLLEQERQQAQGGIF